VTVVGGGRGRSGHAWELHGGWRGTESMVDGLLLHGKLLWRRLQASTGAF